MSLIRNLVEENHENHKSKRIKVDEKTDKSNDSDADVPLDTPAKHVIKSAVDLQRLHLEKLMKYPDKPVIIPEYSKEENLMHNVPTFVRNVMGSSAGAGSGEFHVYRHLRRKEYARQKMIQAKSIREQLDEQYQQKLEGNRRLAEEKTAKKRAKRLKKKQRQQQVKENKKKLSNTNGQQTTEASAEQKDSSEDELQNSNDESDNTNAETNALT